MNKLACYPALSTIKALLLGLALALAMPVMANEVIYTWTDEEGVRHFSAQPPQGREYRILEAHDDAPAPTAEAASDPSPDLPSPALTEISQGEPDPEVVRERCEQASRNLELLLEDRPAVLRRDDGEAEPLDEEAREQMIEETREFIAEWC